MHSKKLLYFNSLPAFRSAIATKKFFAFNGLGHVAARH
jgi:hypothetical protein